MFCASCIRFFRYQSKRWPGRKARAGTCWLDGSKTHEDLSCGMHSDMVPVKSLSEVAPDKRDQT